MTAIQIRPLVADDAKPYRALRLAALTESPDAFTASIEEEAALSDAEMVERVAPPAPGVCFGAFAGDDLVGMAAYVANSRPKTRHKAIMVAVYVAPQARGMDVGRRLVEAVIDHARALGTILNCTVRADNAPARELYLSLGFVPYGVERDAIVIDGRAFDDQLLALDLRADADR